VKEEKTRGERNDYRESKKSGRVDVNHILRHTVWEPRPARQSIIQSSSVVSGEYGDSTSSLCFLYPYPIKLITLEMDAVRLAEAP